MDISQCRLFFKIRCQITPTVRLNFKSDRKYKALKWICEDCVEEVSRELIDVSDNQEDDDERI